ncbi:DUF5709 domain-containing protein [Kitasatospora albolonga]|uniref:DUF5709 domain-containing protein n=1 Tax=Kitasatospora albolonga TaxID=68173 RepID=UPI0031E88CC0
MLGGEDDVTGFDVGPDAGAAGAEEAAVHLVDADQDRDAEFADGSRDESLDEAIAFTIADDLARARDEYR